MNIVVQIHCFNESGIVLEEFNPQLPFGVHLFGESFFFTGTIRFSAFSIVYIVDEGVQKSSLVFNLDLKGVC